MHHFTLSGQAIAAVVGAVGWLLVPDKFPRTREGCRVLMAAGFFSFLFRA
jgi:hypothetical protein